VNDSPELPQSLQQETIDQLRAEVAHLQQELALREQQWAEGQNLLAQAKEETAAPTGDSEDTARLVARMESLLDELDQADQRAAQLEGLLRRAEEAAEAEREERRHLESWMGDIECRVGQREAEWHAERELLRQR